MTSGEIERLAASQYLSLAVPLASPYASRPNESASINLSPKLRADLLDLAAWAEILTTYGRTMRVAVALTDSQGCVLGECHNSQPVWALFHDAAPGRFAGCPFCITTGPPCIAVTEALQRGKVVLVHDRAGLAHIAVPLFLGSQHLGAIIAGQVFDRYPEPLLLRRAAQEFDISAPLLWDVARKQRPVSNAMLHASGELLCALGQAFLQQRCNAILEAKLAETNVRFRLLVEGVTDYALFTMDPTGRVTSWNVGAERMLGYVEAEIVGQNFSCTFTSEDIQNGVPEKQLHTALQAGRAQEEGWRARKDKKTFWAYVDITLLKNAGQIHDFVIVMHDVTEQRKIAIVAEELRQKRTHLQEKFLSHVSHELRTPLAAIYYFTTNILDGLLGDLTPEQHEHLSFVLINVKQLKNMVSDLLDITQIDAYKVTIEAQRTLPVKVIAEVVSTCRANAAIKNISLRFDTALGLPSVWADPNRVGQILTNLIDNGIKFTPENGTITVASRPFAGADGFLCLSVSDTGCGIRLEDREAVFDRLAQVQDGAERSRSGLGLGLFIARELVSRQGGRIWVESELGCGSTFYFTLPLFSLVKLCSHIFTATNFEGGSVTLIAIDVLPVGGAAQPDILMDIRRVLESCIHARLDVLLPSMSDREPGETFFIVACTDSRGVEVIVRRIRSGLQNFGNTSKLKPVISSTTLLVPLGDSREEQIGQVTARIDRLVQTHCWARSYSNE
jgi:PAS domain S-box-containing protein